MWNVLCALQLYANEAIGNRFVKDSFKNLVDCYFL